MHGIPPAIPGDINDEHICCTRQLYLLLWQRLLYLQLRMPGNRRLVL